MSWLVATAYWLARLWKVPHRESGGDLEGQSTTVEGKTARQEPIFRPIGREKGGGRPDEGRGVREI